MPQIQGLEEHIGAQGAIGARANPDDFGAQIGQGMQRLAGGLSDASDTIFKHVEAQDVTQVHVNMAKAREQWTQTLQERENQATPGDDTFAPKLMKDMDDWFAKSSESVKTAAGKRVYDSLAANMSSEFGQRAVGIQAKLAAEDATNQFHTLRQASATAVYNDHTQLEAVRAQNRAAVEDPSSIFGRIPKPMRDKFLQQLDSEVNFAAASGFTQRNPQATLASFSPEQLKLFNPWKTLIDANVAPGGKATISPETLEKAPEITQAAAGKGLNPNILLAQRDAGADQTPKDQAATMGALVDRYGGDYGKALAAYHIGAETLDSLVSANSATWEQSLPPATQAYIAQVLQSSGAVASSAPESPAPAVPPAPEAPRAPVPSNVPGMGGLTWEQQQHLTSEAVRLQHFRQTMAIHAREEEQFQLHKRQEAVMGDMLKKIVEPSKFGRITEDDILTDKTLTWNQQQHMIDYMFTRQRELKAARDSKTNPEEVRRLLLQIYANPDDPNKAYSIDPTMESYRNGRISTPEMMLIRREVDGLRDGSANSFQKQVSQATTVVHDAFAKSIEGAVNPGVAAEAWYRFKFDLDAQIQAKREKNEDPRPLLDPASKEYLLKPERLSKFMPGAGAAMAAGAAGAAKGDRAPAAGYVIGKTYKDASGKDKTYLGGPINLSSSWSK